MISCRGGGRQSYNIKLVFSNIFSPQKRKDTRYPPPLPMAFFMIFINPKPQIPDLDFNRLNFNIRSSFSK